MFCRFPGLMRLHGDDNVILRTEFGRLFGCWQARDFLFTIYNELEAVGVDRIEVRTTRNDRNVDIGFVE